MVIPVPQIIHPLAALLKLLLVRYKAGTFVAYDLCHLFVYSLILINMCLFSLVECVRNSFFGGGIQSGAVTL